jgi:hypothetical protein
LDYVTDQRGGVLWDGFVNVSSRIDCCPLSLVKLKQLLSSSEKIVGIEQNEFSMQLLDGIILPEKHTNVESNHLQCPSF